MGCHGLAGISQSVNPVWKFESNKAICFIWHFLFFFAGFLTCVSCGPIFAAHHLRVKGFSAKMSF